MAVHTPDRSVAPRPQPPASVAPARPKLAIIGNGMVAHRFCEHAAEAGLLQRYELEVFGEEPVPAYDRVHLGRLVEGAALDDIVLKSKAQLEPGDLISHSGVRVLAIDREARQLRLSTGEDVSYDWLVLATGSRALLPNLPGADLPFVFCYRTAEDARNLRNAALCSLQRGEAVVVVGAGLLGLELASQLRALGCEVHLIESSTHVLPRQLEAQAAAVLERTLVQAGILLHAARRVSSIARGETARLEVRLSAGEALGAGFVVFTVGVRPRDELARAAGLDCDLFGGVQVDSRLATSDPRIFAIGECARFAGMSYGVVAPGYAMADVLIGRLLGKEARFNAVEPATRLKLKQLELSALGESAYQGDDVRVLEYRAEGVYRRLTLRDGRVVGATVIGAWEELPALQEAVARKLPLRPAQEKHFSRGSSVWSTETLSLALWPAEATVCTCTGVTCGVLRNAYAAGHRSVPALMAHTGAGTACGSCQPLLASLSGSGLGAAPKRSGGLIAAAAAALAGVALWLSLDPLAQPDSLQRPNPLTLWRDPLVKQITGFSLVGLLLLGVLGFSLRKRWRRASWGSFAAWRLLHAVMGILALALAVAHTGLRLGANLDAALMGSFLASTLLGAVAAFCTGLGRRTGFAEHARRATYRWHLYLAWPLPLFITFHVLKFYYF